MGSFPPLGCHAGWGMETEVVKSARSLLHSWCTSHEVESAGWRMFLKVVIRSGESGLSVWGMAGDALETCWALPQFSKTSARRVFQHWKYIDIWLLKCQNSDISKEVSSSWVLHSISFLIKISAISGSISSSLCPLCLGAEITEYLLGEGTIYSYYETREGPRTKLEHE